MPVSSTVWWPSTCRSPWASTVRSSSACRASASSMWSKNPMPVRTVAVAAAVEVHADVEIGLLGGAADLADAGHGARGSRTVIPTSEPHPCSVALDPLAAHARRQPISPSASATASMSSAVPTEIRRHCASSAAPDTSRTRMPCSSSSRRNTSRAGSRVAPDEHEVGRARIHREPRQRGEPGGQPLAVRHDLRGRAPRARAGAGAPPPPPRASPRSRCRAASPWRSRAPPPGAPARARTGAPPCPAPWRRSGAPPGASSAPAAAAPSGRRTPGRPRRTRPARRSPRAPARPRPAGSAEPVGLLGELSTTTRARSRTAASISASTS